MRALVIAAVMVASSVAHADEARCTDAASCATACGAQDGLACAAGAMFAATAKPAKLPAALAGFTQACALGEGFACLGAAEMTRVGEGTKADPAAAIAMDVAACDRGFKEACETIGRDHVATVADTHVLRPAATPQLKLGCDRGHPLSCYFLGEAIADADLAHAIDAWTAACKARLAPACTVLGLASMMGASSGDASEKRGSALVQRACDAGYATACSTLAFALEANRSKAPLSLYARACKLGDQGGCASLGDVYKKGAPGVPRDMPRALALYMAACDAGNASACVSAATEKTGAEAHALYARACQRGQKLACELMKNPQ